MIKSVYTSKSNAMPSGDLNLNRNERKSANNNDSLSDIANMENNNNQRIAESSPSPSLPLVEQEESRLEESNKGSESIFYVFRLEGLTNFLYEKMGIPKVLSEIVWSYDPFDPSFNEIYEMVMTRLKVDDSQKENFNFYGKEFLTLLSNILPDRTKRFPPNELFWYQLTELLSEWTRYMKQILSWNSQEFKSMTSEIQAIFQLIQSRSHLKFNEVDIFSKDKSDFYVYKLYKSYSPEILWITLVFIFIRLLFNLLAANNRLF